MNRIIFALFICIPFAFGTASAKDGDTLDVFEEYATIDTSLICEDFFIETEINTPVNSKLKFTAGGTSINIEIVTPPKNGMVSLTGTKGEFLYTPNKDYTGTDSFQFRVSRDGESSNIAYCGITVTNKEVNPDTPDLGFVYQDMRTHWANYSAVKLVEADILKGERIGSRYYFHPETKMRRIDIIEYILAALGADYGDVDHSQTHIFADSPSLPEYINESAYLAHKAGFLNGVEENGGVYLRPYEYINRAEMIRMIDIAMSSKTRSSKSLDFADKNSIPAWAVQSVKNLVGYGIIKGFEDNTLRPYDNITKAQTAEIIYQMMKYNKENIQKTISNQIRERFYTSNVL